MNNATPAATLDLDGNGQAQHYQQLAADENYDVAEHGHYLEGTALVYLRRTSANDGWLIDGPTTDGYALDSHQRDGELVYDNDECPCGHSRNDPDSDHTAAISAVTALPNGHELLELLADAYGFTLVHHTNPHVEVITHSDPDAGTDLHVFIDGTEYAVTEHRIDAGAGWTWEDWRTARDHTLRAATDNARQRLADYYSDPAGGDYVENRGDTDWLGGLDADYLPTTND